MRVLQVSEIATPWLPLLQLIQKPRQPTFPHDTTHFQKSRGDVCKKKKRNKGCWKLTPIHPTHFIFFL
jgi:hypothetical protein